MEGVSINVYKWKNVEIWEMEKYWKFSRMECVFQKSFK